MLLFLPTELWHMVIMFSFIFDGWKAPNTPTDLTEIHSIHRLQRSWQGSEVFVHPSIFFNFNFFFLTFCGPKTSTYLFLAVK